VIFALSKDQKQHPSSSEHVGKQVVIYC
jgi:hypothetical protein